MNYELSAKRTESIKNLKLIQIIYESTLKSQLQGAAIDRDAAQIVSGSEGRR